MEEKKLRKEIESLIQEVDKTHRYSMSRIYGAYNKVFDKDEKPQACASCLIRKVKELRQWLDKEQLAAIGQQTTASSEQSPSASPKGKSGISGKGKSKK